MALYQSGAGLGALVGVGTTNPTSNLQVYGTPIAAGNVFSVLNTAASGNVAQFSSSAGTALIINASGNVGIGKTNPGALLDVNGALAATSVACTSVTAQGTAAAGAIYMSGSQIEIGAGQTSDTTSYIDLHAAEGTYSDFAFRIIRYAGANANVHWINRGSGNSYFQNQDSGSFYFQSGGLDIGAITSNGAIYFGKGYTATTGTRPGTNYVLSYDCGTPATPVASTVYYGQNVAFTGGTLSGRMWNNSGAPSFYAADTFLEGTNCYDGTNNGTGAANQYAGNLYLNGGLAWCLGGSGTTNQCYAGNIYLATGLSGGGLTTTTRNNRMAIMANTGYVGIGTVSPTYTLDVSGGIRCAVNGSTTSPEGSNNAITAYAPGGATINASIWMGYDPTADCGYINSARYGQIRPVCLQTRGGNVGIGITNPGAVLTVVGGSSTPVVHIHDSASGGPDYGATYGMVNLTRGADTTKAHVAFIRAGSFVWQMGYVQNTNNLGMFPANFSGTQGTPTMTWGSNGNVGVGVTTPAGRFSVVTSGDASIGSSLAAWTSAYMTVGQAAGTTSSCVALGYNATSNFGILYSLAPTLAWREMKYHAAYHSFHMAGSDIPNVTINSTGVGIGTVSPSSTLDIRGGSISFGSYDTTSAIRYVGIYNVNDGNGCLAGMELENTTLGGNYSQKLHFRTHYYGINNGRRLTISEAGNVGIGNPAPPINLWVPGTSTTTGIGVYNVDVAMILGNLASNINGGSIQVKSAGSSYTIGTTNYILALNPDGGSVGVGTNNPSAYKFNVNGGAIGVTGTSNYLYYAVTNSTNSGAYMLFDAQTAGGSGRKYQIGSTGTGNNPGTGCFELYDATGGVTRMVVNASGNVGINVTNPSYKLHVQGDVAATSFFRLQSDGTGLYSDVRGNGIQINGSSYGHIDTYGAGRNGWSGYGMSNTVFAMQSGNAHGFITPGVGWSFYNDGTTSFLHYSGVSKLQTISTGILCSTEIAMEYYNSNASGKHIGVSGGGYCIGGMEIENTELVGGNRWSQKIHLRSHEFGVSQGRRLTVRENGNIGIGQENPTYKLHITAGDSSYTMYGPNAYWGTYLKVGAGTTYAAAGIASVNCSNGNLHIDQATNSTLYFNYFNAGGNGANYGSVYSYGTFYNNGPGLFTGDITAYYSDERLKTKTGLIENALDKVCSLDTFTYIPNETAKSLGYTDEKERLGLSAQQVQKVAPQVISPAPCDIQDYGPDIGKSKTGQNYLTVQYDKLVPLLVEALKEERKAREAVTCELRSLEERIKLLEQK